MSVDHLIDKEHDCSRRRDNDKPPRDAEADVAGSKHDRAIRDNQVQHHPEEQRERYIRDPPQ